MELQGETGWKWAGGGCGFCPPLERIKGHETFCGGSKIPQIGTYSAKGVPFSSTQTHHLQYRPCKVLPTVGICSALQRPWILCALVPGSRTALASAPHGPFCPLWLTDRPTESNMWSHHRAQRCPGIPETFMGGEVDPATRLSRTAPSTPLASSSSWSGPAARVPPRRSSTFCGTPVTPPANRCDHARRNAGYVCLPNHEQVMLLFISVFVRSLSFGEGGPLACGGWLSLLLSWVLLTYTSCLQYNRTFSSSEKDAKMGKIAQVFCVNTNILCYI